MLTERDYERLRQWQTNRLMELLPKLKGINEVSVRGQCLILVTEDSVMGMEVERASQQILQHASIVFGTTALQLWCDGVLVWADEIQSNQLSEYHEVNMETAIAPERESEFTITTDSERENTLISWQLIAQEIGVKENDVRRQCSERGINFGWMSDGSAWGVNESEAKRLIMGHYVQMAEDAIARMKSKSEGHSPTPQTQTKKEASKGTPRTSNKLSYQKPFDLPKALHLVVERHLEAVAPGSSEEEQLDLAREIYNNKATREKHFKLLFEKYKTQGMTPPDEIQLGNAFASYARRLLKKLKLSPNSASDDKTEELSG